MPRRPLSADKLLLEIDRISTDIDAATERRDRLRGDFEDYSTVLRSRLEEALEDEDATDEELTAAQPTDGESERLDRLARGITNAEAEMDALRAEHMELVRSHADSEAKKDEILRGMSGGGFRTESGDGATALSRSQSHSGIAGITQSRKAPGMSRFSAGYGGAPWRYNGEIPRGGEVVRSAARQALEILHDDDDIPTDADAMARVDDLLSRSTSEGDNTAVWTIASSNPHYVSAFRKIMRNPQSPFFSFNQDEQHAFGDAEIARTAMSLTDGNGGFLVPFTLDPAVILTNAGIADPIRRIATIKQIATNDWSGVSSAGVTAEWLGEGSQAADASPTFAQPTITPRKLAAWIFGSYEVLSDSGFSGELANLMADARGRLEGAAFATGNTGASVPRGIVAAVAAVTASIVTSATTNAFVKGDVYNVADALRPRDASKASWIANKKVYSLIRQFDTAGGSAFWANMGMSLPSMLLGQPQYESSTMGSVVTTGANILLVGNFEQFYVVDRLGATMMYEPMIKGANARPTGQAGWFYFSRVGSDCVDPDAFRVLQLSTTAAFTALG